MWLRLVRWQRVSSVETAVLRSARVVAVGCWKTNKPMPLSRRTSPPFKLGVLTTREVNPRERTKCQTMIKGTIDNLFAIHIKDMALR